jgi:hypothetical protein
MTARPAQSGALHLAAIAAMLIVSACGTAASPGAIASPTAAASPSTAQPDLVGFPDGTYETQITAEEVKDRPQDAGCPCTWGFILEDGAFRLSDPAEQPVDVEFFGDHMTLPTWNKGHGGDPAIAVRWVYDEQTRQVTFSDMVGGTDDDRFVFERTWARVD